MHEVNQLQGRIWQLPPLIANQIAAGEVVERPASVVKELVENSIDAGATKIEVQIEGGGIHLIRVRDNGCGIVKSDLALAFSRHATSKLFAIEELSSMKSLGFRGEALASIASVSHCRMMSRALVADNAWEISFGSDLSPIYQMVSHNVGTTIEVADLFYNTPVRRKFLKSEKSEFQAIENVISCLALSYPEVSFSLAHQQKKICYYPAVSSLLSETSRVGKICGQAFIAESLHVNIQAVGLSLKAWIGKPTIGRRLSDCQYFFVNKRMVKDRMLNHAVRTLYQQHSSMKEGTCPCYVLHLSISPDEVDVNVHPTKQEVRFSQPRLVHDFISQCVANALNEVAPLEKTVWSDVSQPALHPFKAEKEVFNYDSVLHSNSSIILRRYYVSEDKNGIFLVDLLKAKNYLLSTYFLSNWGSLLTKKLLFPLKIKLDKTSNEKNVQRLEKLGFHFFQLEENQFSLCQVPAMMKDPIENLLPFFNEIFQKQKDKREICWYLASYLSLLTLSQIPEDELATLISSQIFSQKTTSWIKLTHKNIANIMKKCAINEDVI